MFFKSFPEFLQWFGAGAFRHPFEIIFSSTQIVSVQSKKRIMIKLAFINRLFKYLTSPIYICNVNVNCFHNQKNFIQWNGCFQWKLWNFDFLKPCHSVFACKYLMHFFLFLGMLIHLSKSYLPNQLFRLEPSCRVFSNN